MQLRLAYRIKTFKCPIVSYQQEDIRIQVDYIFNKIDFFYKFILLVIEYVLRLGNCGK